VARAAVLASNSIHLEFRLCIRKQQGQGSRLEGSSGQASAIQPHKGRRMRCLDRNNP